ncbi:16202_t:CDS:2 [Dentiscutata erythropus]|uniref:16202_t:CDS:1 n=1 Tax=Dentiscutata erythropus TaxID=1348616 RepID=A0A9N9A1J4_9GLOM|nr:16202_t:CDS:2 [Dentiscutata erythropus]
MDNVEVLLNKLSIRDVRAEAYALALSAKNANASSSRLTHLHRELKNLGTSFQIIKATKFPDITKDTNEIQRDRCKFVEIFERIDYPDHFTLESVKERLDKSLEKNQERAKELLTWIQNAISSRRMGNPEAVYAVVVHGAKNLAHAMTITREALRHNPDNNTSPAQNYVIVNYRRKNQLPEEARPFRLYDNVN